MTSTLYELTAEWERLLDFLEANPEADITDTLDAIDGDVKDKLRAIHHVLEDIDLDVMKLDAAIKRRQDRKRVLQNRQERLREYVLRCMDRLGIAKVEDAFGSLRVQNNPPSVDILDANRIPSNFIRANLSLPLNDVPEELLHHAKREPDKAAILKAFKDGWDVPGAQVVQKRSLRVA